MSPYYRRSDQKSATQSSTQPTSVQVRPVSRSGRKIVTVAAPQICAPGGAGASCATATSTSGWTAAAGGWASKRPGSGIAVSGMSASTAITACCCRLVSAGDMPSNESGSSHVPGYRPACRVDVCPCSSYSSCQVVTFGTISTDGRTGRHVVITYPACPVGPGWLPTAPWNRIAMRIALHPCG